MACKPSEPGGAHSRQARVPRDQTNVLFMKNKSKPVHSTVLPKREDNSLVQRSPAAAFQACSIATSETGSFGALFDPEARRVRDGFRGVVTEMQVAAGQEARRAMTHDGTSRPMPSVAHDAATRRDQPLRGRSAFARGRAKKQKRTGSGNFRPRGVGLERVAAPTRDRRRFQRGQPSRGYPRRHRGHRKQFSGTVGARGASSLPNRARAPFSRRQTSFGGGGRLLFGGRRASRARAATGSGSRTPEWPPGALGTCCVGVETRGRRCWNADAC